MSFGHEIVILLKMVYLARTKTYATPDFFFPEGVSGKSVHLYPLN